MQPAQNRTVIPMVAIAVCMIGAHSAAWAKCDLSPTTAQPGAVVHLMSRELRLEANGSVFVDLDGRKIPLYHVINDHEAEIIVSPLRPGIVPVTLRSRSGGAERCGALEVIDTPFRVVLLQIDHDTISFVGSFRTSRTPQPMAEDTRTGAITFEAWSNDRMVGRGLLHGPSSGDVEVFGQTENGAEISRVPSSVATLLTALVPNNIPGPLMLRFFHNVGSKNEKTEFLNVVALPEGESR